MAFQKGQSGNPGGRPKHKPFRAALEMEIKEAGEDHQQLRAIARKLIAKAKKGDMQAIREIADRLDGKPTQQFSGQFIGADDEPLRPILNVTIDAASEKSPPDIAGN